MMMKSATFVALCVVCAVASKFDQTHLEKLRDNVQLKGAVHFAVNGRLECAMACGTGKRSPHGLLYADHGRCQCVTDTDSASLVKGTFELWKIQIKTAAFLICDGRVLYWYGADRSQFVAKEKFNGSLVVDIGYVPATKTLYWVTDHREGIHSAPLSLGKVGPEKRAMFKGFKIDHFELHSERNEVIWMTVQTVSRTSLSITQEEEDEDPEPLITRKWILHLTIDRANKHIFIEEGSSVYRIDYYGRGLKKIISITGYGHTGAIFYNEADKTLYWVEKGRSGKKSIKSTKQQPLGEERTILRNETECLFLFVQKKTIFYKSNIGRGVSVMTVDGERLPAIGTDSISLSSDAILEFL